MNAYGISGETCKFTAAPLADNPPTDLCRPPTCAALRSEIDRGVPGSDTEVSESESSPKPVPEGCCFALTNQGCIPNPCTPSIPITPFALPWPNTRLHAMPLPLPHSPSPRTPCLPHVLPLRPPHPSSSPPPSQNKIPTCTQRCFVVARQFQQYAMSTSASPKAMSTSPRPTTRDCLTQLTQFYKSFLQ
ncbi:hypothetical protein DFH08DRAFT_955492 [Mycena albidolilacea]|uniref:Uncharacterized protein n=1 Tax=Mycena albidolilacea TaxID=1033008 RepID=A0AAD7EVC2_9AGAR|nr:hypothetical protein DFH08DRAFT_955492 [Mycena albidolilacea]